MTVSGRTQNFSLFHHLILTISGVVAALLLLELSLGLWAYFFVKDSPYMLTVKPQEESLYRIVAVGESTTAPFEGAAWPELLENELNRRVGSRQFRVYNLGVPGSNTDAISHRILAEALRLRPSLVISMMGINDTKYLSIPHNPVSFLAAVEARMTDTRTYKFFAILSEILRNQKNHIYIEEALHCTEEQGSGTLVWETNIRPRYQSLIDTAYPSRYSGQFFNRAVDTQAETVLKDFLMHYPLSYQGYETLITHYAMRSMWQAVIEWSKRLHTHHDVIALCIKSNAQTTAQDKTEKLRQLTDIDTSMQSLQVLAQNMMKKDNASIPFYDQISDALGRKKGMQNVDTAASYKLLAQTLRARDVSYIAMQYPLLALGDLTALFGEKPDNMSFVSNDENFQSALSTHTYEELFVDNFAGIFGHTTLLGSQLIASAAADSVLSLDSIKAKNVTGK